MLACIRRIGDFVSAVRNLFFFAILPIGHRQSRTGIFVEVRFV